MKYQDCYDKKPSERTLAENIAINVIHGQKGENRNSGLHDRGGFDHFWDNVDDDIHDEMWSEMIDNIEAALSKHLADEL